MAKICYEIRLRYAVEKLGLGLERPSDYSNYSLEHIKKNHGGGHRPEVCPLIPSDGDPILASVDPPVQFPTSLVKNQADQLPSNNKISVGIFLFRSSSTSVIF